MKQHQGSQTSVDSSLSCLTDSGFTEHYTATSDIVTRAGFRPLSKYIWVCTLDNSSYHIYFFVLSLDRDFNF